MGGVEYVDFEDVLYTEEQLRFLRKKLDDFTIEMFRKVIQENRNQRGLVKTRLEKYQSLRKKYDNSFLILEAQGFIEKKEDGTMTPYYITTRGRQLVKLLKDEKQKREENQLNELIK